MGPSSDRWFHSSFFVLSSSPVHPSTFVRRFDYTPAMLRSTVPPLSTLSTRAIRTRHTCAHVATFNGAAYLAVRSLINVQWLIDAPSVFVSNPDSGLLPRSNRAIFIALRIVLLEALATPILPILLILPPSSPLFFFAPRSPLFCLLVPASRAHLLPHFFPLHSFVSLPCFFLLFTRLRDSCTRYRSLQKR